MASCISCGRALPAISFGQRSDVEGNVCAGCSASAIDVQGDPRWSHRSASTPARSAPPRRRLPITTALVAVNVLVFVAMLMSGVSLTSPTTEQLLKWGANFGPLSLGVQPWRIFVSNYLHIGIIHIALNMWCLWSLGVLAEMVFEPWTYVLTYTACGIGGSIASLWRHPTGLSAGASGAIFGLAGALISALYLGSLPIPKEAVRSTMKSLLTFAGYNLFFGAVAAGIDNSAHIGGLITGLLLGAILAKHLTDAPDERNRWRNIVFIAAALALVGAYTAVKQVNGRILPPVSIPSVYLPLLPR